MEKEAFVKFEALIESPEAKDIFVGSIEDVKAKLENKGIDISVQELEAFKKGLDEAQNGDELKDEELETVAGGVDYYNGYERDCYNAGKKIGKFLKWVFKIGVMFVG